ncbi:inositol monophosphatase family protein [Corynebacterium sp. 335C]
MTATANRPVTDMDVARKAVAEAAALAAELRAGGLDVDYKTSVSDVVTQADRAAEEHVVSTLAELRPDDGILGEEGSAKESRSGRTWVIDPVDGTYNFTAGSDYWCSALALVEGDPHAPDRVLLGAVHQVAGGRTWIGGPELPTERTDARGTRRVGTLDDGLRAASTCAATYLHSSFFGDGASAADDAAERAALVSRWSRAIGRFATWRALGSASLDLAGVADGREGAWFQHSVAPWDWLPGFALVAGAGGAGVLSGGWRVAGPAGIVGEVAAILADPAEAAG